MEPQETFFEEHPLLPEYSVPPEYTPEYPDVSFFHESYVTAREENIFGGEAPSGETDPHVRRREERQKSARFSWLKNLLTSALRGGAALAGVCTLLVTVVPAADIPEDSPWAPVKAMIQDLKGDSFHTPDDYTPEELIQLWSGDPEGPHQYDFEHAHVRREASCREDGILEYVCTECGVALPEAIPAGHTPAPAVRENERAAGCTEDGGYDDVVYCSVCHEEISRSHTVYEATGHTSAEPVMENIQGALCTEGGRYDSVVYCADCHTELSRETISTDALGHTTADEAVTENEIAPSCTETGSYDSVLYCSVCQAEISRETVMVEALGHRPGFAEKENEKASSCTEEGSYDSVICCLVCGEELSRETVSLPLAEHIETQDITENHTDPDCTHDGAEDIVVYCDVCGQELSRNTVVLEAAGHSEDEAVIENEKEPGCTEEGGYDEVVYCLVCGEELSRTHTVTAAAGHRTGNPKEENRTEATCQTEGGYDTVVYCSICGDELSRTHTVLAKTAHTAAASVQENESAASCTAAGSYDEVVYCSVCHTELSRNSYTTAALGHNYGEWSVTTAATCTADGVETQTCSRCGNAQTRTVTALGHDYDESAVIAASCTADGYTTHTCSRCGDSYTDTPTAALGHNYGEWSITTPATCTAEGLQTQTCSRCGSEQMQSIAALGHNYSETVTAATCTADGYTTHTCSRCGDSYTDSETAALGHTYTIGTMNWDFDGPETIPVISCDRCGTPAFTVSFVNANTLTYTIDADFWAQADEELGFFEWGDCVAYEDAERTYGIGYIASGYNEATSRTGTILLDFTPVSGTTYYYKISLRIATSGSSDDVCFVAPEGGAARSFTEP